MDNLQMVQNLRNEIKQLKATVEKLKQAEELLIDYQELIRCDYSKEYNKFDKQGLYMQDLAEALGENASIECERIYLLTEKYLKESK